MRVLIVEDDDDQRALLALLFHHLGTEADGASDGDEGAEKFCSALSSGLPYRLVVLDLALPRVDGARAARLMREAEREAGVRRPAWIEGYTAYMRHVLSVETFSAAGVDHITQKGGDPARWAALVAALAGEEPEPA